MRRIELFIDGTFYLRISNYYKFGHKRAARIDLKGVIGIAETLGGPDSKVVRTRIYRGKSAMASEGERLFENYAMHAGAEQIFLPCGQTGGQASEKGVDVILALDALESAMEGRCESVALVTGDMDFLPLLRRLHRLGKPTILMGFEANTENHYTGTSVALQREAMQSVLINNIVDAAEEDSDVMGLFPRPRIPEQGQVQGTPIPVKCGAREPELSPGTEPEENSEPNEARETTCEEN